MKIRMIASQLPNCPTAWRISYVGNRRERRQGSECKTLPESQSDCESLSLSLRPEERLSHLPWTPREKLGTSPLVGGDDPYSLRLKLLNDKPLEFLCRSWEASSNSLSKHNHTTFRPRHKIQTNETEQKNMETRSIANINKILHLIPTTSSKTSSKY